MNTSATKLRQQLETLRAAAGETTFDLCQRQAQLAALAQAVRRHQQDLLQATDADFGGRAHAETCLLELFPLYDQIRHARRHLRAWMRRRRVRGSWFLLPAQAFYEYQPLGVVGIIGAWNYPSLLTLGPMVDAIAAGNRVMLKPSELAPRTAQVIARIVAEAFMPDHVVCINGDAELAQAFSTLPLDHLFFTGSTRVGRLVMQAAACNLTPVTLELGGKSPAIIHDRYDLDRAVARIMTAKLFNAGQTCVAPDYVLLPAGREAAFEAAARRAVAAMYPCLVANPDYSHIISDAHAARLRGLLENARDEGARLARLAALDDDDVTNSGRTMAPTLLFEVNDTMQVLQEEIFGPLLPVVGYRTLDDAIAYVNARPRPLALYYFDDDRGRQDRVLAHTRSGGVTLNDCLYHLAQHNLPFGGIGASGMGHYHGFDGFVTFSKKRAVMRQRRLAATDLLRAPWSRRRWLLDLILRIASR
jgi:coniferyl-aldehyde dehydrogenase